MSLESSHQDSSGKGSGGWWGCVCGWGGKKLVVKKKCGRNCGVRRGGQVSVGVGKVKKLGATRKEELVGGVSGEG